MAFLFIGVPVALFVLLLVLYALFAVGRIALGFNGIPAMLRFYWGLLLVAVWLAVCFAWAALVGALSWPALDYFANGGAKAPSLGPAIVAVLMVSGFMASPVVATKVAGAINRAKTRVASSRPVP